MPTGREPRTLSDDLDLAELLVSERRALILAPLTGAVRAPAGNASLGVLLTMVDFVASRPAMIACRPDRSRVSVEPDVIVRWTGPLSR